MTSPGGQHNLIAARVHRALLPAVPDDCEVFWTQTVGFRGICSSYVPDLCVAPVAVTPPGPDSVPAEHVLLAVEITSRSDTEHDRKRTRWA